jgi:anti-sigma-K factor RskA
MERNPRIEDELFPFYALDALTAEEREEVERYVAGNPEAQLRLAELLATATDFGETATPIAPPPAIKAGLMARIEAGAREVQTADMRSTAGRRPPVAERQQPARSGRRSWWSWAPAAGLALALVALLLAGGLLLNQSRRIDRLQSTIAALETAMADLEDDLGALRVQNEELRGQLRAREDQLASLLAPGAVTVALGDLTGEHPQAGGALTIDPASGEGVLSVANLPPLDETQTYQAWLIVRGAPVSAGTFNVDQAGAARHQISGAVPGSFEAVGVSIEPAGGSEQPTPDQIILLAGFPS